MNTYDYELHFAKLTSDRGVEAKESEIANTYLDINSSGCSQFPSDANSVYNEPAAADTHDKVCGAPQSRARAGGGRQPSVDDATSYIQVVVQKHRQQRGPPPPPPPPPPPRLPTTSSPITQDGQGDGRCPVEQVVGVANVEGGRGGGGGGGGGGGPLYLVSAAPVTAPLLFACPTEAFAVRHASRTALPYYFSHTESFNYRRRCRIA
ncbi:E3 ubiquitin-protein ligase RNF19B-like [Achroia grisella]|uniref:E3 ubiquitin-protein ligase RNF19B-like n=1 Tax=Achroia grisella TaxID=688607 RepID=UPI0027D2F252|nr:E3 ubiquitin-protein ligase RNF19B-like [Achroia grisella]